AIESAMDELARALGMDPFELRRRNVVRPGDELVSWHEPGPDGAEFGSYGLGQCLDLVEEALDSGRGLPKPEGDRWVAGSGMAAAMHETSPPTNHVSEARLCL